MDNVPKLLPVTLLSGFLGAGKTTLLKHILQNKENIRCAVIVNDMAELNVDAELVKNASVLQREEKILEMHNGCICCTLRADLLEEVARLAKEQKFDYLIIESTGISEPMQVAETFTFKLEDGDTSMKGAEPAQPLETLQNLARLDTCVTVVDALNFFEVFNTIDQVSEKYQDTDPEDERTLTELLCDQIEFSNVILINKTDLVQKDTVEKITAVIKQFNPDAEIICTVGSRVDLKRVLNTNKFDFAKAANAPGWLKSLKEEHTPETIEYGISSFVYRARKPFHPQRLYNLFQDPFYLMLEEPAEDEDDEGDEDQGSEGVDEEGGDDEGSDEEMEEKAPLNKSVISVEIRKAKSTGIFAGLLRSKGFLWLAGRDSVHGEWSQAGLVASLKCGGPWFCEIPKEDWPEEAREAILKDCEPVVGDRRQELVFIGQFTPESKTQLIKALDECLCQADEKITEDPWVPWPTAAELLADEDEHDHDHEH